jgi:hypothetical protein
LIPVSSTPRFQMKHVSVFRILLKTGASELL